jgi:hypothetical protein
MTRQDFIAGVEFTIKGSFFKLDKDLQSITKVFRSIDNSRVVMEDYHMNVTKVGKVGFEAFTYILGKEVVRKIRFEDLEVFKG